MYPTSGSATPTGSEKPTIQIVSVEDATGLSWLLMRDYEPISRFDQYEDAEAMMQQMLTGDAPLADSPFGDNGQDKVQDRRGLSRFFSRR
ncbi:MAG: hypothetical protein ACJ740_01515 [Gaiellales bacterium]